MVNPTQTPAWQALKKHSLQFKDTEFRLTSLFQDGRFDEFSASHEELLLDFSKHYLSGETLKLLTQLADECGLQAAIHAMFAGEKINSTENRAVLHTALRAPAADQLPEVTDALTKMTTFVEDVHSGKWTGADGAKILDIVNIGIGGSDLGPAFVVDALATFASGEVELHFASNVDPSHLNDILASLNPSTTLFIIASKSFNTLETHQNALLAKRWFLDAGFTIDNVANHFVAITSNLDAAEKFGLAEQNLFPMWDWVGGRYSLWSAIGLSIALSCGMDNFKQLLAGANTMDEHFRSTDFSHNLPVISALLSVWYINFFDAPSTALVPYSQRLNLLPAFLQQLYMESLGKSVNVDGQALDYRTGETLWGTPGTNGQHSYFQLLHQGTEFIPVEFIAFIKPENPKNIEQHNHLLANCLSQSMALMTGDPQSNPHINVTGNKPSSTLLIDELTPTNLGSLIAYFEHKVFVQSVIWNINAFDQWGVQLGKVLSKKVVEVIEDGNTANQLDESTIQLIKHIHKIENQK
jgi:glucose-6-phosphate isomerase